MGKAFLEHEIITRGILQDHRLVKARDMKPMQCVVCAGEGTRKRTRYMCSTCRYSMCPVCHSCVNHAKLKPSKKFRKRIPELKE